MRGPAGSSRTPQRIVVVPTSWSVVSATDRRPLLIRLNDVGTDLPARAANWSRALGRWRASPPKLDDMPVLEFDPPDRFIAGAVGSPGQRTFFLQVSAGPRLATVSLEKQQLSTLADRLNDLLDDFAAGEAADVVAEAFEDSAPLVTPIEDEFRVGTMSLGWDAERRVVIVECHDEQEGIGADEEDEPTLEPEDPGDFETVLRVVIDPAPARAFARRCSKVVAAGRPLCPFCGGPLDPTGHICPRANGYKR